MGCTLFLVFIDVTIALAQLDRPTIPRPLVDTEKLTSLFQKIGQLEQLA
jgi:hypothetical protein